MSPLHMSCSIEWYEHSFSASCYEKMYPKGGENSAKPACWDVFAVSKFELNLKPHVNIWKSSETIVGSWLPSVRLGSSVCFFVTSVCCWVWHVNIFNIIVTCPVSRRFMFVYYSIRSARIQSVQAHCTVAGAPYDACGYHVAPKDRISSLRLTLKIAYQWRDIVISVPVLPDIYDRHIFWKFMFGN